MGRGYTAYNWQGRGEGGGGGGKEKERGEREKEEFGPSFFVRSVLNLFVIPRKKSFRKI